MLTAGKVRKRQSVQTLMAAIKRAETVAETTSTARGDTKNTFSRHQGRHTFSVDKLPKIRAVPSSVRRMQKSIEDLHNAEHGIKVRKSLPSLSTIKPSNKAWGEKAQNAKDRRILLEADKRAKLLKNLEDKKVRISAVREKGENESRQKNWLKLVAIAASIHKLKAHVLDKKADAENHKKMSQAVLTIQNAHRRHYNNKMKVKYETVAKILVRYEWKARLNLRTTKRKRFAGIIRSFFRDHQDDSQFASIVKSYRYKIIRIQRHARHFLRCRKARLICLGKIWDSIVLLGDPQKNMGSSKKNEQRHMSTEESELDRDNKILNEGRQEVAKLTKRWEKTQEKLLALIDFKRRVPPAGEDAGSAQSLYRMSSKKHIQQLLNAVGKRKKETQIIKPSNTSRTNSLRRILKHERQRFVHGEYARYRLEKAHYSPGKPRLKNQNSIEDAKRLLQSGSSSKGQESDAAQVPMHPCWRMLSNMDVPKFHEEIFDAFAEAKKHASRPFVDLFFSA